MKNILLITAALMLFAACKSSSSDPDPDPKPTTAKRTVIVYMAAETNLNAYAQDDINEMIAGMRSVGSDYRLLLFVDRASTTEKPFIARVTGNATQPMDTLYQYAEDFYSSDPDRFREVLGRAQALCPAESYGLVLWGHADGWVIERDSVATGQGSPRRAYGIDNGRNTTEYSGSLARWLNIPSMRTALTQLGTQWKFIFTDCCNMLSAEVAYELRGVCDYLIGSPAEITGVGAPYDVLVKDFFITGSDEQMYRAICDDYHAQVDYVGGHLPISVVRTANVARLAEATRSILPDVQRYLLTEQPTKDVIYYYAYNKTRDSEKVMYDMKDMVSRALADQQAAYSAWLNILDQTVVYSRMSTYWHANCVDFSDFTVTAERFGGISMFFPLAKYLNASHAYNETARQMGWYHAVGW